MQCDKPKYMLPPPSISPIYYFTLFHFISNSEIYKCLMIHKGMKVNPIRLLWMHNMWHFYTVNAYITLRRSHKPTALVTQNPKSCFYSYDQILKRYMCYFLNLTYYLEYWKANRIHHKQIIMDLIPEKD